MTIGKLPPLRRTIQRMVSDDAWGSAIAGHPYMMTRDNGGQQLEAKPGRIQYVAKFSTRWNILVASPRDMHPKRAKSTEPAGKKTMIFAIPAKSCTICVLGHPAAIRPTPTGHQQKAARTMILQPRQILVLFGPLLLLAACGASGQQHTVRVLDQRLQTRLEPDIKAGRATLQSLSDGAQVTLLDPTLFSNTADALDNRENDPRASIMEALLDPSLMRLRVADNSSLPDDQRDARVRNVTQYLVANGVGLSVLPKEPPPPAANSQGVTVTINVQCPDARASSGYGPAIPTCD